jgi:hypothetical protein
MKKCKTYRVKILDFCYLQEFSQLNFRYLFYEVTARHKEEAVKIARDLYMKGEKELSSEELPFLLKLFAVDN